MNDQLLSILSYVYLGSVTFLLVEFVVTSTILYFAGKAIRLNFVARSILRAIMPVTNTVDVLIVIFELVSDLSEKDVILLQRKSKQQTENQK